MVGISSLIRAAISLS